VSALLAAYDGSWAVWVAVPVAVLALLGGLLDVLENNQLRRVVRLRRLDLTEYELRSLRWFALGKWFALSLVVGALSIVFFLAGGYLYVLAVAWALLGAAGVVGAIWKRRLLPLFFTGALAIAGVTALVVAIFPGEFEGF
jgi:hypothetical protein